MQLKRYANYQIDFGSKAESGSCAFMGLSIFLRLLHYVGVYSLADHNIGYIIAGIILPLLCSVAYIYFLKIRRKNAPGLYGIIGAVFCLLALIGALLSDNFMRIIPGAIWYPTAMLILLATVNGNTPDRLLCCISFVIPILYRFGMLLFGISLAGITETLTDCSTLAVFACMSYMLIPIKRR